MKNMKKALTATAAAIIASTAMISTASAATYIDYNGNLFDDGINDGIVCYEDYDGSIYAFQDNCYWYSAPNTSYSFYDTYNYYTAPTSYFYYDTSYSISYVGRDCFYGDVYYDPYCGYYATNGNGSYISLGWNFSLTKYVGTDRHHRCVYYNDSIGYFVFSGNSYISYGFNSANISWY
jgi:hypothetical protein